MGVHVSLILNPLSHVPPHPIPQGHPSALALSAGIEGILMNQKKKITEHSGVPLQRVKKS